MSERIFNFTKSVKFQHFNTFRNLHIRMNARNLQNSIQQFLWCIESPLLRSITSYLMLCSSSPFKTFHSFSFFSQWPSLKCVVEEWYNSNYTVRWNAVSRSMGWMVGEFWTIGVRLWLLGGKFLRLLVFGF